MSCIQIKRYVYKKFPFYHKDMIETASKYCCCIYDDNDLNQHNQKLSENRQLRFQSMYPNLVLESILAVNIVTRVCWFPSTKQWKSIQHSKRKVYSFLNCIVYMLIFEMYCHFDDVIFNLSSWQIYMIICFVVKQGITGYISPCNSYGVPYCDRISNFFIHANCIL